MAEGLPEGAVRELVAWVGEALRRYAPGAAPLVRDVRHLTTAEQVALVELLGEGEVVVASAAHAVVREARFPGVWCHVDGVGAHPVRVEVGERPTLPASRAVRTGSGPRLATPPADVMNGPAVLAEIEQHRLDYRPGSAAHTVNLSRLPITPGDHGYLEMYLGEGEVSVVVRGYGETRATAAAVPHVWRVRHYNATDQLLLDAIEVSDFPTIARATPEDIADSAARLAELLVDG
jgi:hydrogenase-1 operon protein HyaF